MKRFEMQPFARLVRPDLVANFSQRMNVTVSTVIGFLRRRVKSIFRRDATRARALFRIKLLFLRRPIMQHVEQ